MRSRRRVLRQFLIGWIWALAMAGVSVAKTDARPTGEVLRFDGNSRTYYLFVPSKLPSPAPVLVLLHSSGRDGISLIGPWQELAQEEGIILVAPDSINRVEWDFRQDGPDFLHAVLEEVESRYGVDRRRVYLFGQSAGAMQALFLSLAESQYFAATAIHAGSLLQGNFKLIEFAKRRIPISMWVGTHDQFSPPEELRATRDAFNARGFAVELHELSGQDPDYDRVAGKVNRDAWQFLKKSKLGKDPDFVTLHQLLNPAKAIAQGPANAEPEPPPQPFEPSLWAGAKPYVDYSFPELKARLPELHGLEPAPDQQPLAELLKKTSDKSLDLLSKMPNVMSHESVVVSFDRGPSTSQDFAYLVLRHDVFGVVKLDEYRIEKGKTVTAPVSQGTANAWVLFYPGNLDESRFRYLGRQPMDGHATVVLAFAQIPDKVRSPAQARFQGMSISTICQGIVWVDETDFRIVRLRSDLLAPRPDVYLRTLSSEVHFADAHIHARDTVEPVWLPREVNITWDFRTQVGRQLHKYSDFHLYRAESKIVM